MGSALDFSGADGVGLGTEDRYSTFAWPRSLRFRETEVSTAGKQRQKRNNVETGRKSTTQHS